jgi:hypothetical protein
MTLDTMGFELRNPFQHLFLLDIPKLGIQNWGYIGYTIGNSWKHSWLW